MARNCAGRENFDQGCLTSVEIPLKLFIAADFTGSPAPEETCWLDDEP